MTMMMMMMMMMIVSPLAIDSLARLNGRRFIFVSDTRIKQEGSVEWQLFKLPPRSFFSY